MFRFIVILTLFLLTNALSTDHNNSSVLISKYAKVVRWGANSTNQETGRSNGAQSIWTPRSSSASNSKNQVVYQYPVYRKVDEEESEKIPGIGEVIQDRFQVRPYFGYGKIPPNPTPSAAPIRQAPPPAPTVPNVPLPSRQAPPPSPAIVNFPAPNASPPSLPSLVRPAAFNTGGTPSAPQVPSNLYDSPFTSYNPPPSDQNGDSNQDAYPPNSPISDSTNGDSSSPGVDSYADIPVSNDGPYQYQSKPAASSPKPMMQSQKDNKPQYGSYYDDIEMGQNSDNMHSDRKPSMDSNSHGDNGRPNHPPKSIDDVYYPPDFPKEQIPHDQNTDDMAAPDITNGDMTMDLVPPSHGHDFPKYLYDSPHYDHHVYEEVHHTTTAAPEKKRVSTTNYSYYYLGRKLWYIPLYFSIYFMLYVTALIIKSIARHKVTYRNDWITANSRSARDLTFDHMETIDNIHRNISVALDRAGKLYSDLSM